MIQTVLKIVRESLRESDLVVRMGGDEFVAALNSSNAQNAEKVFLGIEEKLKSIRHAEQMPYPVSISYGIIDTLECPEGDPDKMVHLADTRMYANKKKYKLDRLIDQMHIEK